MDFQAKWSGMLYIVPETEVSFRPCLTDCNKKAEVIIPPSSAQLDYFVVGWVVSLFVSTVVRYLMPKPPFENNCSGTFPKGIYPKENKIARLGLELAYYGSTVSRFNHYTASIC